MKTTDKYTCRALAEILSAHGVHRVVISPGSRNTPLIIAFNRQPDFQPPVSVIDERCAGFIALGMAIQSGEPVAVISTSGSALLNLAPAVVEAYYRHTPIIVISADRPQEWIDRNDSQTMRQPGALSNYVKGSYNLPCDCNSIEQQEYADLLINNAILAATTDERGPVHINVPLAKPLDRTIDSTNEVRKPQVAQSVNLLTLTPPISRQFLSSIKGKRVLIVSGFNSPNHKLSAALSSLCSNPGFVLIREAQSNIHVGPKANVINNFSDVETQKLHYNPDLVIVIGGSILSSKLKDYLRNLPNETEFWEINLSDNITDCFSNLAKHIKCSPEDFFHRFASVVSHDSGYTNSHAQKLFSDSWLNAETVSEPRLLRWCDANAIKALVDLLPANINLQVSNGNAIRHLQRSDYSKFHRIECNRGISGIDGCTSTAIGSSIASTTQTILLTGDMSAQYDLGTLACTCIPDNFKIIVVANGNGAIFHNLYSPDDVPELNSLISPKVNLPLEEISKAYGFTYFSASNFDELRTQLKKFINHKEKAIFSIQTS